MTTRASTAQNTMQIMRAYTEALLSHGDFGKHFSDDIVCVVEGTDQRYAGREAVQQWIIAAHSLGDVRERKLFAGEAHAVLEADFVRQDNVSVPYSAIYEIEDGLITALRLYFSGPVQ
jgi:hypothetical protein